MSESRRLFAALVLAPILLAGCGDDPITREEEPSAAEAGAHVAAVVAVLHAATAPTVEFRALELAGGITADNAVDAPLDSVPCSYHYQSQIFRDASFGVTYAWDPGARRYIASAEEGAPSCGLRIVVHRIDDATGLPALPLEPIGFIEGRDAGSYWGNPRYMALHVDIFAADSMAATWFATSSTEFFSRGSSTHSTLYGRLNPPGGDVYQVDVDERRSTSGSPGASYDYTVGSRSYVYGEYEVTTARNAEGGVLVSVAAPNRIVTFALARDPDTGVLAGPITTFGDFEFIGVVGTVSGSFGAATFVDTEGAPLPVEVEAAFDELWAGLSTHFGFATWMNL